MLTKQDIITIVDPNIYAIERQDAHKGATHFLHPEASVYYYYVSDLPGEISDLIWNGDTERVSDTDKLRLIFDVYRDLPCYDLLQELVWRYPHFSADAHSFFWNEVSSLLAQPDDALAGPLCYMLWGDFLELDPNWQAVWWRLVTPQANTLLLKRLLACSFSIPFHAREPLYQALLGDPSNHDAIFHNLLNSYYTVYGHIDKLRAQEILSQLVVTQDRDFRNLWKALSQGDRYSNYREWHYPPDTATNLP